MNEHGDTQMADLAPHGGAEATASSAEPDGSATSSSPNMASKPAEATSPHSTGTHEPRHRRRRRRRRSPTISIQELEPGMELTGMVRNIQPFGAFVDIGAETDGLVHISELRDGFVEKVEDVVQVGDMVTVRVKDVDVEQGRISLTMRSGKPEKATKPERKRLPLDAIQEGQEYTGVVASIVDFGAFVDIGAETDGLVHISELSDTRVNRVEDVVTVGQEVTVRVISVDRERQRISLTMRTEPDTAELTHYVDEERERESSPTLFAIAFARAAEQRKQKRRKGAGQQEEDESPMMDIIRRTLEQLQSSDS
ncbi:MAG: S1 RNA-binding domain-containing protein [Ardenticatenia bacterium]|nr:S1 RNA-binding domain-containing protein [Ardenticatenia bacterium]